MPPPPPSDAALVRMSRGRIGPVSPVGELRGLVVAWQERVKGSRSRAEIAAGVVMLFAALLLGRHGTVPWRTTAAVALVVPLGLWLWATLRERALWEDPSRVIRRLAWRIDADRAGRAIRAWRLIAEPTDEGTSSELAHIHVARTLAALPRDRILDRATRVGGRFGLATLLLAVASVALAATRGFAIFEGADVLFAANRRAPIPILWLNAVEVLAHPPDYLHEHDQWLSPYMPMALPRGTVLTFRGIAIHTGRHVLLSDGTNDVPFVDDGAGHVVARWTLTSSEPLTVIARFGEVAVPEPETTSVVSLADDVPTVTIEGAPREIRLADVGVGATIPIKYEATDDHGLREVQLVLRSGARQERRNLARLDGETTSNRGGPTVRASDPFIKRSHAPVLVTVEAEDNDTVTGPKWGASAIVTVIPPEAGELEALRLDVLRTLRNAFVDSLALRIDESFTAPPKDRARLAEADRESVASDDRMLDTAAKASLGGLTISRRLLAVLRGQMRRVKEALNVELRSPGSASHGRLVAATERLVLVTDAVMRGLAQRDSRSVARSLADVAEDLMLGASQMQRAQDRERGKMRADASVVVLEGGSRSLLRLGSLGRDLGEIVQMDLARVARAREQDDAVHAEIAAADLAARLKDPDPSFGAQGSSGGRAGGESGGGRGTPGEGDPGDDAEQGFDQAAQELGQLSADHAEELGKVENMLNEAETAEEESAVKEDGKSHARAVREATKHLPSVGAGSDSWTNKGSAAREHAEAMARALEEGNAAEAVASGHSALDALEEAKHVAERERWGGLFSTADPDVDRSNADQRLEAARQKLEPEVAWAAEKLQAMRKRAVEQNASQLSRHGDEEDKLAERAGTLREGGEGSQAMPGPALEALHQAETAAREAAALLKRGLADEGLSQQREAQRRLEAAKEALGEPSEESGESGESASRKGEGDAARAGGHTDIPDANAHKGPAEFRRRVIEGLGQGASGRQADAIRRYAEGLLR